MIKNIIVGLLMLVVLIFAIGFVLPDKAHIKRSITIDAPASEVFALVDGFRQFDKWSPWSQKDPNLKVEMSGAPYGVGAKYAWSGNKDVGSGDQEVVESTPYSKVVTKLHFGGFDQPSIAIFTLEPAGPGTQVTWSLDSELGGNPLWHYFGLFMDKMVGPDYETGLARLKTLAESQSKTDFSALQIELIDAKAQPIAYVSGSTTTDVAEIGKALQAAYGKVGVFMKAAQLKESDPPMAIARRYDDEAKVYEFDAAIPIDQADAKAPEASEVKIGQTYAGQALKVQYKGAYSGIPKTCDLIDAFKKAYALQDNGNSWEQYVSDPGNTPEADLITFIVVPVK